MEQEIEAGVIKATQNSLGKYVKRPPLSDKLLKKPPFRFLHDIVTSVLKTTGFFEGLFDQNELVSDNVKDRESKILFLNKVISVISLTTGKNLAVKSSKIVAGQEPEKTNELLQCLALALDKKLSSDEAVKKVKEKSNPSPEKTQSKENRKQTKLNDDYKQLNAKSSEKLTSKRDPSDKSTSKNEKDKNTENKIRKKDQGQVKQKVQPSKAKVPTGTALQSKSGSKVSLAQKNNAELKSAEILNNHKTKTEALNKDIFNESIGEKESHKEIILSQENVTNVEALEPNNDANEENKLNSSYTIAESETSLALPSQDLTESETNITDPEEKGKIVKNDIHIDNNESESIRNNSEIISHLDDTKWQEQPTNQYTKQVTADIINTPTITRSNVSITRPASVRPSSSRPSAPRLRDKLDNLVSETDNVLLAKVNIITENARNEEEEENSLVIIDSQAGEAQFANDTQQNSHLIQNEHGHLVQQILDSQKELSLVGKTEIEWHFGVQKAKEAQHQEIEQLRFNIQAVSRVANPLGKLLDHIQEDVEVMRQELQQWKTIYEEVSKEISKQKSLNEDSLQPLHAKLKQIEMEVEEKNDKICDMKILIHKNTTRMEKLLNSGNVQ